MPTSGYMALKRFSKYSDSENNMEFAGNLARLDTGIKN